MKVRSVRSGLVTETCSRRRLACEADSGPHAPSHTAVRRSCAVIQGRLLVTDYELSRGTSAKRRDPARSDENNARLQLIAVRRYS